MLFKIIKSDLSRYINPVMHRFEWNEPSWTVVVLYRIARRIRILPIWLLPIKIILNLVVVPLYAFMSIFVGVSIPRSVEIGRGLRVCHFGAIIIGVNTKIGTNFTIHQGCTIGAKSSFNDFVTIGDDVTMCANSMIIGNVNIGNNVTVGANSLVMTDVPDNSIVVGMPARIIPKKKKFKDYSKGYFE